MIDIRTDLLPIKAHFLLFFGGASPVILFIATLAKQLGFSAVLVGTIFTVLPLLGMTSKLIMGAFADRFQCHKSVIIVFLMMTLFSVTGLMFIPPINRRIEAELVCNSNSTIRLCSENNQDKCIVSKIKSEHKINSTVHCQMECSVDDQFIESVCTSWNGSRYCELPINTKKLKSTVKIEKTNRIFTNISNARNNSSILFPTSTTSPILRFDAELLPHDIEQEGRCLSVQIGGIKDETNNNGPLHVPFCEIEKEYSCQMVCNSPVLTDIGKTVEEESTIKHYQFWIFVLLMSGGWIGMGTTTSVGETICFGLLGDKPSEFGKQRLWGSLGWGIMSLVGGLLVDTFSNGRAKKNYTPIFITSSALLGLDLLVSLKIKDTKRKQSKSIMLDIGKLLMNIRIIIYLIWCVLMGMSNGIIANFLFWHLEDLTDCDGMERIKTLEGLYVTIQSFCGELPFFFLNCWVLNKLGHVNAMSAMLFTFGTIFVLFSILDNPLYFLPISLLNGITFSTMYATMASYASIIAPPGTEATMLGLVGSVYEGIGLSFGNFIAGILMHYFKGAKVFRIYGIAAFALCVLHVFLQFLLERSNNFAPVTTKKDNRNSVQYTSPNNAVKMLQTNEEPEKKP